MEWISLFSSTRGPRTLGIASITGAVLLLSLSDALVKLAGERFALSQIVFLRSAFAALLIVGGMAVISDLRHLRPKRPGWVWLRSLCLMMMWLCYYAALPSISLALAAACYYTSPMWMAVLSRLLLGEPVGRLRWIAILLALAGVVVAVNPGVGPGVGKVSPVVALPLAAAFFYALAAVVTWSRCRDESPLSMALNLNVVLTLCGAVGVAALALFGPKSETGFVLSVWRTLGPFDWALAGLLGAFLAVIAPAVAQAYRLAPSPLIGIFDNAYLIFAALWSVLFFGEVPGAREGLGMAMIATGAIVTAYSGRP